MSYMKAKPPKPSVVEEIDRNLKQAFEDVANEPVPERFSDLLNRLKSGHPVLDESDQNAKTED